MKKIFALILTFSLLFSFNINASKNFISNDFDQKNSKKFKTFQKIFNTKIGKWFVKKAIKKIQKNQLKNDIKNKNSKKIKVLNHTMKIFIFGTLLFLVGLGLLIGGYTALGIILGVLGLIIVIGLITLILLIGRAFSRN